MERYETVQENTEQLCDSQITDDFLRVVLAQCASGKPPFNLYMPSQILHQSSNISNLWGQFLTLRFRPNKPEDDSTPFDSATVFFDDCIVCIIGRRCIPIGVVAV